MRTVTYEQAVIEAAQNLVKVKGRHHSEQAYQRLLDAVNALAAAPAYPATAVDAEQWDWGDHREFYAIGRAINRAPLGLPRGARLRVELERDAGTVYWLDGTHGAWRHIESGELFSYKICAAIDAAMRASEVKA